MHEFNYTQIPQGLMTTEIINMIAVIHEYKGKQNLFTIVKPKILKKLLEIAKVQSTGASNRIESIVTTEAQLKEICEKKT